MPQDTNHLTRRDAPQPVEGRVQITRYRPGQPVPARPSREHLIADWHVCVRRCCRAFAALLLASVVVAWTGPGTWNRLVQTASVFSPIPAYTVAGLLATLQRDPNGWSGRVVLVSGTAHSFGRSGVVTLRPPFTLSDPEAPGGAEAIVLAPGGPDPMLTVLRRLPLVGQVAPSPQWLHWGEPAVYRIKLRPIAALNCDTCYEAVLLDPAPGMAL